MKTGTVMLLLIFANLPAAGAAALQQYRRVREQTLRYKNRPAKQDPED
ncbi:MAG TPA: hypothetical protein VGX94_05505 [Terriglobia bacterium]|nr:hypothetical protein [Terriglobia bacterium]